MDEVAVVVRKYLRRHVGNPVRRCQIYGELHIPRATLSAAIDVVTNHDARLAEADDGTLLYLENC